jgi:hypothetical protein
MGNFDIKVAVKYMNLFDSAKKRNKQFDLTLIGVANLLKSKKCYYTGKPLNDENRSIDRIHNDLGYVTGNVVACRKDVNAFKRQLSVSDILNIAARLKKHHNKATDRVEATTEEPEE